jgi:hypothetical protein
MTRALKNAVKRVMRWSFEIGQRCGWDVLPRHFYSEVPDLRKLKRTTAWKRPYSMTGVAGWEIDTQAEFVRSLVPPELVERLARGDIHPAACERNGEPGFGLIEAECLFAFVLKHKPQRIVQIGCGVSTAVCLHAAAEAGYRPDVACVEPYPTAFLRSAAGRGEVRLIPTAVENLPPDQVVGGLTAGDLLFVDSSHALGPAGEVSRVVLELLPRLTPGVTVHFHDIYFPYDYPGDLLTGALFFHHESALLHAFLAFNRRFRLLAALSALHHLRPDSLRELFRNYRPRGNDDGLTATPGHFPSSAYLLSNS